MTAKSAADSKNGQQRCQSATPRQTLPLTFFTSARLAAVLTALEPLIVFIADQTAHALHGSRGTITPARLTRRERIRFLKLEKPRRQHANFYFDFSCASSRILCICSCVS